MRNILIYTLVLISSYSCLAQDYEKFEANDKYGFKNKTGKVVIPAIFESVWDKFSEGLVGVYNGKKWGYIDSMGKAVIPFKYDEVSEFSQGRAIVYIGKKMGCLNSKGEAIVPVIYDDLIYCFGHEHYYSTIGTFLATLNGKSGVLDNFGKIRIPFKYQIIDYIHGGNTSFYIVNYQGKYGTIDDNNKLIIPLKYDLIKAEGFGFTNKLKSKLNGKEGYLDYLGKVL